MPYRGGHLGDQRSRGSAGGLESQLVLFAECGPGPEWHPAMLALTYLELASAGGGAVEFPESAQRDDLAFVVDPVGEHTLGDDLVSGGLDHDVADVGFLVAALIGLL